MKKLTTLITVIFIVLCYESKAQITQLELASGFKKTDFTSFSLRPLTQDSDFSVGTLAFFQKYHEEENQMFDEAGVQSTLYLKINKAILVGPGLYYNSVSGFSERLSIFYAIRAPHFILTIIPTVAHAEKTGLINGEMFLQMQLTQPLNTEWKLLLSAQMLSNWEKFSNHTRSFQQIRAGFEKQTTQFGLAIDFDQYGDSPITKTSLGVFIRKIFLNN
ncbi:hypothetical protein [Mangrovivirga cuniculi]|uniref:DUF2490 domain-containing protein n=1 Tax=Mangrovivirga cuniculi TaxID=2715131 RepID=A0A4D7JY32_9BACT|nr:hypothetical protein [Mangrovivirga cuniculi]QCK15605.1 hypothetical protein DCC35_13040 [Mangrovivirga cuniculi]